MSALAQTAQSAERKPWALFIALLPSVVRLPWRRDEAALEEHACRSMHAAIYAAKGADRE
jgi:hypothetical protein